MARYKIDFKGIDRVESKLGAVSARRAKQMIDVDLEEGIERMANEAGDNAPVDTGYLKETIYGSPRKLSRHHYMFGSIAPYAQRQEYEHNTKNRFFYKAVLKEAPVIKERIARTIENYMT